MSFITAKNLYYAFDICPGFWKSVVHHHRAGRVFSIDRVRSELLAGHKTEDLIRWVRNDIPNSFFIQVDTDVVVRAYTDIMMWAQCHPRYFDIAKAKFATGADGWLVAYARVHGSTIVTNEQSAPESRREGQTARCMRSIRSATRQHVCHASSPERPIRLGRGQLSAAFRKHREIPLANPSGRRPAAVL